MKITLIGPTYPFKGGIAHYMTLLYRQLTLRHKVNFLSFKRQYPGFLYPAKTDADSSRQPIKEAGVEYVIDSLNPISWHRAFKNIKRLKPDLVILSWWVCFWTPVFLYILNLIKKHTNAKTLFICHNVAEHEDNFLSVAFTRLVLKNGDYFIVHSEHDKEKLSRLLPDAKIKSTYHPSYEVFNFNRLDKNTARKTLGIKEKMMLFFGFIRDYKGLEYALKAMPLILKETEVKFYIVGEFWKHKQKYTRLIYELNIEKQVVVIDRYVPNEEVELYFAACDVVVLPYISATGSGIVQVAFGFERPVIATTVGSLGETVVDGKTGYLISPKDSEAIAEAVIKYYNEQKEDEFKDNIKSSQDKYSWQKIVEVIESFTESEK
jgi:glycosyltransferase involved in cell wall biosynthesis